MSLKVKYNRLIGFTLVELLISLVIVGMLLAAVAVALNASIINYRENEEIFRGINSARQALVRMTSQIRNGLVDANNITDEQTCEVVRCDDGVVIYHVKYYYDAAEKHLKLYDYTTNSDYLLCDNVTAIVFKKDLNNDNPPDVKSVRISITLSDGGMEQKLSAAAVVRRVLDY